MELIEREAALNCAEYDEHYRLVIPVGKVKELTTIEPIRAAGGCYCRECRFRGNPEECPLLYFNQRELDEHNTGYIDFCSYGEPWEAQEDG